MKYLYAIEYCMVGRSGGVLIEIGSNILGRLSSTPHLPAEPEEVKHSVKSKYLFYQYFIRIPLVLVCSVLLLLLSTLVLLPLLFLPVFISSSFLFFYIICSLWRVFLCFSNLLLFRWLFSAIFEIVIVNCVYEPPAPGSDNLCNHIRITCI